MKRVHIVGCPRSGTTLLMELLSTCFSSDGYCEHEMSIFKDIPKETIEDKSAALYFSKQPSDIKHINHIFFRDSQLFVIYLTRDPRAVMASIHRQNTQQYFCNYRIWKDCDGAAQVYQDHPRFLYLRYEDLVADPDKCQAKIEHQFDFMRRKFRFTEFEQHAQPSTQAERAMNGLRAVNTQSLSSWMQHLPRIKQQLQSNPELARDLQRLNYEVDEQWCQMLENIEPEDFPCRYPEQAPYFKELEKNVRIWLKSKRYLRKLAKKNRRH